MLLISWAGNQNMNWLPMNIPILQDCPVYQRVDGHPVARGYVAGAPNGDGRILVHGPKSESPVFGLTYWVVIKLSSVSS